MTDWNLAVFGLAVGVVFCLLWIIWSKRSLSEVIAAVIKMIVTFFLIIMLLSFLTMLFQ